MNLIEQLGGYELAKQVFDSVPKDGNSYTVTRDDTGASFHSGEIFKALLEYRRQHNIFEVGDICKLKIKHDFGLYKFQRIEGDRACLEDRLGFAEFWVSKDVVEHATDAEIAAGKRL